MTSTHETSPKRQPSEFVTEQEAEDLSGYYLELIDSQLRFLSMPLHAGDTVKTRTAEQFSDKLVVGLPLPDPNTIAMLVASDDPRAEDMQTILTVPTDTGFPLMIDKTDNSFWCNFFYLKEGDVLQPVRTDTPIRVHGILPNMQVLDGRQDGLEAIFPKNVRLNRIAASKWITKELFADAGLTVPRGFILGEEATAGEIASIIKRVASGDPAGLVIKANMSSEGEHVKMFPAKNVREAGEYAEYMLNEGHDVIVEERILPYALPVKDGDLPVDYNLRIITTLGKYPKIVASEVRTSAMSGDPVNVARGAGAYPVYKLHEHLPEEVLSNAYNAALIGSEVLVEAAGGAEGPELFQFVGFDIIPAQNGQVYILEINPMGGGIGTLTRLAKGVPPEGIVTKLLPAIRQTLHNAQDSKTPDGRSLRRLPLDSLAYEVAGYTLYDVKQHERVLHLMKEALQFFPYHPAYRQIVAHTYYAAGYYKQASEWYAEAEMYAPSDTRITILAAMSALLAGDLEDVLGILDENISGKSIEDEVCIAGLRALTLLRSTDDLGGAISEFSDHYPEPISKRGARRELLRMQYELDSLVLEKTSLLNDPFAIPDWLSLLY